jgi:hypothetical protein
MRIFSRHEGCAPEKNYVPLIIIWRGRPAWNTWTIHCFNQLCFLQRDHDRAKAKAIWEPWIFTETNGYNREYLSDTDLFWEYLSLGCVEFALCFFCYMFPIADSKSLLLLELHFLSAALSQYAIERAARPQRPWHAFFQTFPPLWTAIFALLDQGMQFRPPWFLNKCSSYGLCTR